METAVHQQLDDLLPTGGRPDIRTFLYTARVKWMASLERKVAQLIENVAPTVFNTLEPDQQISLGSSTIWRGTNSFLQPAP